MHLRNAKSFPCQIINSSFLQIVESEETIQCYLGLTVTDAESGDVLFHHQEEQQCKVHKYCQIVTLTSTSDDKPCKFASLINTIALFLFFHGFFWCTLDVLQPLIAQSLHQIFSCAPGMISCEPHILFASIVNFRYSGCGDPSDTMFEWGKVLPFVPTSATDESYRQRQCAKYGCYETILGCK